MTAGKSQKDQLKDLLRTKTKQLSEESLRSGNIPSPAALSELAAIEQLIKSLETSDNTHPSAMALRWPFILLLVVTLTAVSILLFARVSSTQVDMDLSLSEAGFRLSKPQVLTAAAKLSSLGVAGLQEIQFPRSSTSESRVINAGAIKLSNGNDSNALTLSPILLQKEDEVWLRTNPDVASEYHLFIRSNTIDLQAAVWGNIATAIPGSASTMYKFSSPQSISMNAAKNDADLTMQPVADGKGFFMHKISIDSLSLFHIDEYLDSEYTVIKRLSTVLDGKIYYESLGGQEYKLRANQEIYFKTIKGFIRTMEIKNGQLSFSFHGTVSGMGTGGDINKVSLMPTYLEWLKAQHSLSLFWGTTIYLFGFVLSLMHWWKTTR